MLYRSKATDNFISTLNSHSTRPDHPCWKPVFNWSTLTDIILLPTFTFCYYHFRTSFISRDLYQLQIGSFWSCGPLKCIEIVSDAALEKWWKANYTIYQMQTESILFADCFFEIKENSFEHLNGCDMHFVALLWPLFHFIVISISRISFPIWL